MSNKKYTFESISEILKEYGFNLLEYISTKNIIANDENGYKYKITLCNFRNGRKPNKYMKNPFALQNFELYLSQNYPYYHLLDKEYIDCKTKMSFICDLHTDKGVQSNSVDNIVNNHHACIYCGCKDLWERKRTTIDRIIQECDRIGVNFISRTSKNNECYVNYICPKHSNIGEQSTSWTHFKEISNGCPYCNKISKGENKISTYLQENNIEFIKEYKFKNCKYKRVLPFDFYLPKFNLVIEYNGQQHYEPVTIFGGENHYNKTVIRDEIKIKYCRDNNIDIIIIPYWSYNRIEEILSDKLIKNNKI